MALASPDDAWESPLVSPPGQHSADQRVMLETLTRRASKYGAALRGGGVAELTLNSNMQEAAEEIFRVFDIPVGAAAVVSIPDGRVLALAGRASGDKSPGSAGLALRPWAPAASVFKVVAATALVGEAGLSGKARTCYHGGVSSVLPDNLLDLPTIDRRCDTLGFAIGKSQNALIAKLVARNLRPDDLARTAAAFGFGRDIPFDAPMEASQIEIPSTPLEFARAAAGFYHSSLSALHGALIAAAVANRGEMPMPRLIARAVGSDGHVLPQSTQRSMRVMSAATATEVGHMMELTTRIGTAKGTFRDRRGRPYLPVDVAGKTGSLPYRGAPGDPALPVMLPADNYLGFSWFVGYAPADNPRVAFAVVLGNRSRWHIKAPYVARRLIVEYLATHGDGRKSRMLAAR